MSTAPKPHSTPIASRGGCSARSSARRACWRPAPGSRCWRVLRGSIVAAALQGPPEAPWYAIGSNLEELWTLIRRLATSSQSRVPAMAGYRVGIAGSLWLFALSP